MSRDIRSFFTSAAKPKANGASATVAAKPVTSTAQKRKTIQLDSDSDDDERKSAVKSLSSKLNKSAAGKKRRIISSDEDEPTSPQMKTKTSQSTKKEMKPVDVLRALGSSPIKRVEKQKKGKASDKDKFNDSVADDLALMDVDDSLLDAEKVAPSNNNIRKEKPVKEESVSSSKQSEDKSHRKSPTKKVILKKKESPKKKETPRKKETPKKNESPKKTESPITKEFKEPSKNKKETLNHSDAHDGDHTSDSSSTPSRSRSSSVKKEKKPKANQEPENLDYSFSDPDQVRHERKQAAAMLYKQFQKRSGPANPGSKEIPKGKPNCLAGLTFVLTGVFDSLERDEAADLIKELGGKTTTSLSKKTGYMVVGEECGPAKMAKAEELGTKILSEDGLLDLIREKSGIPVKTRVQKEDSHGNGKVKKEKDSPAKKVKVEINASPIKTGKKEVKFADIEAKKEIKVEKLVEKRTEFKPVRAEKADVALAWVDKYKPQTIKDIIGQQGAGSNVEKLIKWLNNWPKNNNGKVKHQKPNPWAKNDDGAAFKAALLSGPPGVGKTTTAQLVAKHLGFDVIEFNASDTRNKKLLQSQVSELLSNKTLHGYFNGNNEKLTEKQVLLMDEVDGMAGNEDRGGIQELINLIKNTSVPIICMCNDRSLQKMRTLTTYCFDLSFARPRIEQIKGAIMSILFKEKVKIPPKTIEEIVIATNNDVRQSLNSISLIAANTDLVGVRNDNGRKDLKLGPWEVVRKVFSAELHKDMSLGDKAELFFYDYSMSPLFVQQTYLTVAPKVPKSDVMKHVALTADSLTLGDMVEKRIRSSMAWSLLPIQAMYSSVLPGEYMSGTITSRIEFPKWLGRNSTTQKRRRLAQELHDHTRIRTSASRQSIRLDYAPRLLKNIVQPMIDDKLDGVEEALSVIKEYRLLREDLDALAELSTWPGRKNLMDSVEGKVKAALTRAYNKEVAPYTYSAVAGVKKSKASYDGDIQVDFEGDGNRVDSSDEEDDDSIANDTMIKAKKPTAKSSVSKGSKAGTSGSSKAATKKPAASKKK